MATPITFGSDRERATYKMNETHRLFADHLEKTKGKKLRLLRLFIYDNMPHVIRPNCYMVKFDSITQAPVQHSRPHVEFRKTALDGQTYDLSLTEPGIYFYEYLRYWGEKSFSYQKTNSGYFSLEATGEIKRILKSEVNAKLLQWEKDHPTEVAP